MSALQLRWRLNSARYRKKQRPLILHRLIGSGGRFYAFKAGIAHCGAKRSEGAEFTSYTRLVSCPRCKEAIAKKRAEAKARFQQAGGVL